MSITDQESMSNMHPDDIIDIHQLAGSLNCSVRTIHRYVKSGQLPKPTKLGGKSIWLVKLVRERIEERCRATEAEAEKERGRLKNYAYGKR